VTSEVLGREPELAALGALVDRLRGGPGALVLAGAAGAGKTTLLRAGAALAAAAGFTVLQTVPVRSELPLSFAGLADLLERHLEPVIGQLPGPQARALRVALLLDEVVGHPPEPRVIAAGFRSAIGVLARAAPVLLVIDDVQWLDPPSQAAVGFAVRRLLHEPVGLLCVQRTSRPGAELPLELARARPRTDVVPVDGLSLGALHRLLTDRLGTSFSHLALRRIEAASGGNPFIALEIGRALARRGVTSALAGALPVPGTVSGLVDERLGELPPAVVDAVQMVAVMPYAPVARYLAAGVRGNDLDAAVLAGVLEPEDGRLRFSHPLLASAVSGTTPPARLRELHLVAARHAALSEERVRHQALAADGPSASVAADLDAAARTAAARGAPATAAELFELAASLTPDADQTAGRDRRLATASHLALAGETRAAATAFERLIGEFPAGPQRAAALRGLAGLREDDFAAGMALLWQARAEAGDDPARTADIHLGMSDISLRQGDRLRALAAAKDALADAERAGDTELIAIALAQVYDYTWMSGLPVDEGQLTRAMAMEGTVACSYLRSPPSWVAGLCHYCQGRLDQAESELRTVLSRAEADGVEYWRSDVLMRLSQIAARRGRPAEAARLAAGALEIAEQLDLAYMIAGALYAQAGAALLDGDAGAVRALAERGAERARTCGAQPTLILHQALLGSLDLALGDYPAAASQLRSVLPGVRKIGLRPTTQVIWPDAVEALIGVGATGEAAAVVAELERAIHEPVTAALVARSRGMLAAAHGDLEAAERDLAEALRFHDQVSPMPVERGRTLLGLGAVQRRLKQWGAARNTLAEAAGLFEQAGARLWAERTRAEQARVSGRAPGPRGLTETEQRVTELVARGLSNRQVAAELFVTVRAVESTLTKAYAKLGITSRTQLAARLHRGG
jgi:DNA-binding CsgD family transcriptional regulator